jgi:hypothetical protein
MPCVISYLIRSVAHAEKPESALGRLDDVCARATDLSLPISGVSLLEILRVMVEHGQTSMFEKNAARHKGVLSLGFFDWMHSWLDYDNQGEDKKKWADVEGG